MIRNGTSYEKMKNYRLAVDENGSPFVLNSKGSIDFGYITEEMNLTPAPIRVAEGNEDYGLVEILFSVCKYIKIHSKSYSFFNASAGLVRAARWVCQRTERMAITKDRAIADTYIQNVLPTFTM